MKLSGPDRYPLTITPTSFKVECSRGTPRFSGLSTSRKRKLYVVSVAGEPIYVGITKQPIRNRLRFGGQQTAGTVTTGMHGGTTTSVS